MLFKDRIDAAFARLVSAINAVDVKVSGITAGAQIDDVTASNTKVYSSNKTNTAIAALIDDASSLTTKTWSASKTQVAINAILDDATTGAAKGWSSTKIQAQINSAITALIGGADINNDTLNEIAARITANANTDLGKLSFAAAQTLTTAEMLQGSTNLGIGNPDFDFTVTIAATLRAGL